MGGNLEAFRNEGKKSLSLHLKIVFLLFDNFIQCVFLKIVFYYLTCMGAFLVCMSVIHICVEPLEARKDVRSPMGM